MQFQVPQFIEVEDKIFGPLTFKQFVYVGGGLGAAYLLWRVLPIYLAGPLILGVGGLAAALAFMQWNGRPFILALENGFYYLIKSKLYLWSNEDQGKRQKAKGKSEPEAQQPKPEVYIPKLAESKLHELAWSLDIKERIAAGVAEESEHVGGVVSPIRTAREALVR
ncbi:PrgI family protein [Candidatus Kaiserbacteria bacterium]|nr:PrgI family protein [Candidatus Kaiserbacteria bacterium]